MAEAPAGTAPDRLPSGRHDLERAFVAANQRDRIIDAMADEVASKGFAKVTTSEVIARAGVSSKTFYELFRDKNDCFLAAYDAAVEILMHHVEAAYREAPEHEPERARAVLAAVLETFAAEPTFARMCMVEAASAGPEAIDRYVAVVNSFTTLVERMERDRKGGRDPEGDATLRQAVVGGIAWVIYGRIVAGETERLPDLLPQLTYFLLAPFLGEKEASAVAFAKG